MVCPLDAIISSAECVCGDRPPDEWPSFGTQYLKVGEPISTDGLELHEAKDSCKAAILKLRCEMFAELGWKVGSSVET